MELRGVHIMNARNMPKAGIYEMRKIDANLFFDTIQTHAGGLTSHVGYPANIEMIKRETSPSVGINLHPARLRMPIVHNFDIMLIMSLKYTKDIPNELTRADFDYFYAVYYEDVESFREDHNL